MDKFFLGAIFVLSTVLAFYGLNELQSLPLSELQDSSRKFWSLTAFGYGSAALTLISGVSLALLSR